MDSTGIKFLGEGQWKRKKHGAQYGRQWRKAHLGIDATSLQIRAIEVTSNAIGDAAMAVIPPRKNASHWKKSSPGWAHRNEAIAACKRLGQRVTARTFERQVVELHVRVALLNRFSQIGRPRTVPVAAVA